MLHTSNPTGKMYKYRYFFPILIPLVILAVSYVVMLLWNYIFPSVLHTGNITYWQSVGLLVLCRILFGGAHFGKRHHDHIRRHHISREKWNEMSEEERKKFREEWRMRCMHKENNDPS